MSNRARARLIWWLGVLFCIVPSAYCGLDYFPMWRDAHPYVLASGVIASGLSIAIISCVVIPPLAKIVKTKIADKTPSAWLGFMIVAVVFWSIQAVAKEIAIIFTVAAMSNLIGAVLFRVADKMALVPDVGDEEDANE